jgi:hypothetical protein
MGHSTGGLVTELLLDRGLGAAGVALSPAPVKGVLRLGRHVTVTLDRWAATSVPSGQQV